MTEAIIYAIRDSLSVKRLQQREEDIAKVECTVTSNGHLLVVVSERIEGGLRLRRFIVTAVEAKL